MWPLKWAFTYRVQRIRISVHCLLKKRAGWIGHQFEFPDEFTLNYSFLYFFYFSYTNSCRKPTTIWFLIKQFLFWCPDLSSILFNKERPSFDAEAYDVFISYAREDFEAREPACESSGLFARLDSLMGWPTGCRWGFYALNWKRMTGGKIGLV